MSKLRVAFAENSPWRATGAENDRSNISKGKSNWRLWLLACAATSSVNSVAAVELVEIVWDGGGRFEQSVVVPVGEFVEVCGKFEPGQTISWKFGADLPLDFNIHYHEGKDVIYPEKREAVQQFAGRLLASTKHDYCWMWSNEKGAPARVVVTISRMT